LSKRQSNDELLTVIRALLATSAADGGAEKLKRLNADDDSRVSQLTDREFETLILIGQGLAPRHVADRMHLSVNTVEAHRQQLKEKLQLESAAELSRFAVSWLRNHRENRSDGPYQPTDDESPESPISRHDD
jgi:DNA-binding NarL/FixJ family response regulator